MGPDQRSVSSNILDAVGSIPSIDGAAEPEVVYVNKENVHHIREGLYAWDRAGKYRVRLTTKYIREFGEIIIRVPESALANPSIDKTEEPDTPLELSYYQSLPENKREEITIIDPFMVEVGMGTDLISVASNIQDAIKSIPSVSGEDFPEFVNVNSDPIFFIGNGLYSWDSEGSNPVRLTTPFIKKFGNIKVSVPGKLQSPPDEIEIKELSPTITEKRETPVVIAKESIIAKIPSPAKPPIAKPKKETVAKVIAPTIKRAPVAVPNAERVASVPGPQEKIEPEKPVVVPSPPKAKGFGLKGFRKAYFGMDIDQVKNAIQEDFHIDDSLIKVTGQGKNIIAISTDKLSESGETASVQYLFRIKDKKLVRVHVIWGPSENTDNLAVKLIQQFLSLRFLKSQTPESHDSNLYYGKDRHGNELKLSWVKMLNDNASRRPLSLSYLAPAP